MSSKTGWRSVEEILGRYPRVSLAQFPTPLVELHNLSEKLGGPSIFLKRDDLTGFALGGTKARMLEFHLGDAKRRGCDVAVLLASAQSNYCRQLAAAASQLGMETVLLFGGDGDEEVQGNLLLDKMLGAEIRYVEPIGDFFSKEGIGMFNQIHREVVRELLRKGHRPVVIDKIHRPSVWSIAGTIHCAMETVRQLSERGLTADYFYVPLGSGATFNGLFLGMKACGQATEVVGVVCGSERQGRREALAKRACEAAARLGIPVEATPQELVLLQGYAGDRHWWPSPKGNEAIRLLARTEGVFLDPVYSAKAMAALIDQIQQRHIGADKTVVILHTGGTPTLFAFASGLVEG
jgi:1-aminocyclopropane-1-carboxylate deaminase/D-cysteine desulfhydrase-like pyridoxal-dependent ACC family enzyme